MTLLVREVARFLLESAIWVGAAVGVAGVVGWLASRLLGVDSRRTIGWCVVGAFVVGAAANRLGLPATTTPLIGTRPLPVLWLVLGAVAATIVMWRKHQESATN